MKYTPATHGRTFVLKFDHGDDFYVEIHAFCQKENISMGTVQFIGAVKSSRVVVGPETETLPPEPKWQSFDTPQEVIGFGTIFCVKNEPKVHLHTVFSHDDKSFIGCIRDKTSVFIVIEAIVSELISDIIRRGYDSETGLNLLTIQCNIQNQSQFKKIPTRVV